MCSCVCVQDTQTAPHAKGRGQAAAAACKKKPRQRHPRNSTARELHDTQWGVGGRRRSGVVRERFMPELRDIAAVHVEMNEVESQHV